MDNEFNELAVREATLPAHLQPKSLAAQGIEVNDNLGAGVKSGGVPTLTIKDEVFGIKVPGESEPRRFLDKEGQPYRVLPVVIIAGNPELHRSWYEDAYTQGSNSEPDCFSRNGLAPDANVKPENKQSDRCAVCPQAQWKSARQGGGKACRENRHVAVMLPPMFAGGLRDGLARLRVPPASLSVLKQYQDMLLAKPLPTFAFWTLLGFGEGKRMEFRPHLDKNGQPKWLESKQFNFAYELSESSYVLDEILDIAGGSTADDEARVDHKPVADVKAEPVGVIDDEVPVTFAGPGPEAQNEPPPHTDGDFGLPDPGEAVKAAEPPVEAATDTQSVDAMLDGLDGEVAVQDATEPPAGEPPANFTPDQAHGEPPEATSPAALDLKNAESFFE